MSPSLPADLRIRALAPGDEAQATAAHAELVAEGSEFLASFVAGEPWASYLDRLEGFRLGHGLPARLVPETCLVGEADGALVGMVRVRHALNRRLVRMGGHIGYVVRPAYRRRGVGTALLARGLREAAAMGIDPALVTCADDNLASITMIERAGGRLDGLVDVPGLSPRRRYWIATGGRT